MIAMIVQLLGTAPTLVCHDTDPTAAVSYEAVTVSGFALYQHMIEPSSLRPALHHDIYGPNRLSKYGSTSYRTVEGRAIFDNNCETPAAEE
jgi:hypothetical protein